VEYTVRKEVGCRSVRGAKACEMFHGLARVVRGEVILRWMRIALRPKGTKARGHRVSVLLLAVELPLLVHVSDRQPSVSTWFG
jgi:hypothetical protein